jgi:1-acyl-sn-glycerol-3-phosphate acyltransferase
VPFDATPHASAPTAVPLGSAPRPHPGSPSVPFEPTPHAGTPSVAPRAHEVATHGNPPGASELPAGGAAHAAADGAAPAGPPDETAGCAEQPTHHPAGALARPPASLSDALKGVWRAVRAASGLASRSTEVDAWGKDAELTRQLRPLAELLYEKYWRVQTDGIEHVPRGGCILVANHAGALPLDGPVLHLALERERPELADARWLLEDQVFHAPFVGLLANRLGAVRASPENALRLLSEGRPVIVFPEGFHGLSKRFGERYQLRRFGRGGYLKIAIRAGVPVVPVAIVGGEESMPLLGKVPGGFLGVEYLPLTLPPLPARWLIRFAPPIDFAGAPATPEDDLAWIERTNVAVRDQIERMLGELLAARPKVF